MKKILTLIVSIVATAALYAQTSEFDALYDERPVKTGLPYDSNRVYFQQATPVVDAVVAPYVGNNTPIPADTSRRPYYWVTAITTYLDNHADTIARSDALSLMLRGRSALRWRFAKTITSDEYATIKNTWTWNGQPISDAYKVVLAIQFQDENSVFSVVDPDVFGGNATVAYIKWAGIQNRGFATAQAAYDWLQGQITRCEAMTPGRARDDIMAELGKMLDRRYSQMVRANNQ